LYLRDKYKNGLSYEPNFISEAKVKIGDEFQYAAYLLGLKLGHEHTYDCLYEELPLAIFKSKAQLFKEKEAKRLELERFQEEERRRENERRFHKEEERNKKNGKRGYGNTELSYEGDSPKWGKYDNQESYKHSKGKSKGTPKDNIQSRMNPEDNPNVLSATVENDINPGLSSKRAVATPKLVTVSKSTVGANKGKGLTDDAATAHSSNDDGSTLRNLPHFPAKMVKLNKNKTVKKSPKPKLVNNAQEYAKMLDEGWVLERKDIEQLTMFDNN
jgi:hypothetical protein